MPTNDDVLDQFAGLAMQAILSNPETMAAVTKMGSQAITYEEALRAVAERSYAVAAAMVLERADRRKALPEMTFGADGHKIR
jgi:hypothetical protein